MQRKTTHAICRMPCVNFQYSVSHRAGFYEMRYVNKPQKINLRVTHISIFYRNRVLDGEVHEK